MFGIFGRRSGCAWTIGGPKRRVQWVWAADDSEGQGVFSLGRHLIWGASSKVHGKNLDRHDVKRGVGIRWPHTCEKKNPSWQRSKACCASRMPALHVTSRSAVVSNESSMAFATVPHARRPRWSFRGDHATVPDRLACRREGHEGGAGQSGGGWASQTAARGADQGCPGNTVSTHLPRLSCSLAMLQVGEILAVPPSRVAHHSL